jgi:hypothetical protein
MIDWQVVTFIMEKRIVEVVNTTINRVVIGKQSLDMGNWGIDWGMDIDLVLN